jgi:hypothetical protein
MKKIIFTGILEWHLSLFSLKTHFLSLRHLPAIGAGAPVRLTRLRSRNWIYLIFLLQ